MTSRPTPRDEIRAAADALAALLPGPDPLVRDAVDLLTSRPLAALRALSALTLVPALLRALADEDPVAASRAALEVARSLPESPRRST